MVCTNLILDRRLILNDHELGSYECKDHLGNVHLVLSDRKPFQSHDNTLAAYEYYPFGMLMQGYTSANYRYGFNGMEKDDEVSGSGNSYTTYFRAYDSRLGRWKSIDPLVKRYPNHSPYESVASSPILLYDSDGKNPRYPWGTEYAFSVGQGSAEVVMFNSDKASYYVSWIDNWLEGDKYYAPRTINFRDAEIYYRAKSIDIPIAADGPPSWDMGEAMEDVISDGNDKIKGRSSYHKMHSNSYYREPWTGWTGGWAGAASSNDYTFIDNVFAEDEYNKIKVMDGVIESTEHYKLNSETKEFVLEYTETYQKTDKVRQEKETHTSVVFSHYWGGGSSYSTYTTTKEITIYEVKKTYSDGRTVVTEKESEKIISVKSGENNE